MDFSELMATQFNLYTNWLINVGLRITDRTSASLRNHTMLAQESCGLSAITELLSLRIKRRYVILNVSNVNSFKLYWLNVKTLSRH